MDGVQAVGFAFNADLSRVVMIQKNHPEEQAGKLNGVGGGVNDTDNDSLDTMVHEFQSEGGLITTRSDWKYVMSFINKKNKKVDVYCARSDYYMNAQTTAQPEPSKTEEIVICNVNDMLKQDNLMDGVKPMIYQSMTLLKAN
jgi:hypothetical protein